MVSTGRRELFDRTVSSLRAPGVSVYLVDNSSDDGSAEIVASLGGFCSTDGISTCGHGTNLAARVALGAHVDLCVLSDDDMEWRDGWAADLCSWWQATPPELVLTGCHLEPEFPWNPIVGTGSFGGIRGVFRGSTGAASWSFRPTDWPKIGPIPEKRQGWGDVPACDRVIDRGYRIAQLDLADHAGAGQSSWGNRTEELYGWDVHPVRALLGERVQ